MTMKTCIYKAIGRQTVPYFNFLTTFSDIQLALNNRPLTYRNKDNALNVITPNHSISGHSSFDFILISEEDAVAEDPKLTNKLSNSLHLREVMLYKFSTLCTEQYLLTLRANHRNYFAVNNVNNFSKDGAIVLIKHPQKPRPFWSLGTILKLIKGSDEFIRIVKLKRGDGMDMITSVTNLCPLELATPSLDPDDDADDSLSPPSFVDNGSPSHSRPVRRAAAKYKDKFKSFIIQYLV